MKKLAVVLAGTILCLMLFASFPTRSQGQKDKLRRNSNKIANHYIVVLDDAVVGEKGACCSSEGAYRRRQSAAD
jgi:hypothetical protein